MHGHRVARAARAAEWLTGVVLLMALGVLLALHLDGRPGDLAQARLDNGARDGAIGGAALAGWFLFLAGGRRFLAWAGKALAEMAENRAARRRARRATMLKHADPELAAVADLAAEALAVARGNGVRQDRLCAEVDAFLAARGHRAQPETAPMPAVYLATLDGVNVDAPSAGGDRNSA